MLPKRTVTLDSNSTSSGETIPTQKGAACGRMRKIKALEPIFSPPLPTFGKHLTSQVLASCLNYLQPKDL